MLFFIRRRKSEMMVSGAGLRRFVNLLNALGKVKDESGGADKLVNGGDVLSLRNNGRRPTFGRELNRENAPSLSLVASNDRTGHQNTMHLFEASAIKLEKLNSFVLLQAAELKRQQTELEEKSSEIERLKAEIDTLKIDAQRTKTRTHTRLRSKMSDLRPRDRTSPVRTRNRSSNGGVCQSSKVRLEIIRLSPTSSKIRRVRQNGHCSGSRTVPTFAAPTAPRNSSGQHTNKTFSVVNYAQSCPSAQLTPGSRITVPDWHILHFSPSVILDGTEDITDDAYLKRHHKYFVEEKRVNRRDRLREKELELYRRRSSVVSYLTPTKTPPANQTIKVESSSIPDVHAVAIVDKIPRNTITMEENTSIDYGVTPIKRRRH